MKQIKILACVVAALCATSSCTQQSSQKNQDTSAETTVQTQNAPKEITHHSNVFMYEQDMEWEPAGEGATRQIVGYNDDIMMVKVKFEKGGIGTAHKHKHTQVTYVASGSFEFTIGGEKKIVKAGDALYMEPNVEHGCVCLEAGLLIDCFSPYRDDFLKK